MGARPRSSGYNCCLRRAFMPTSVMVPAALWEGIAASIAKPWPDEAVEMDLVQWGAERPSRAALGSRWGWSDWQVRRRLARAGLIEDQHPTLAKAREGATGQALQAANGQTPRLADSSPTLLQAPSAPEMPGEVALADASEGAVLQRLSSASPDCAIVERRESADSIQALSDASPTPLQASGAQSEGEASTVSLSKGSPDPERMNADNGPGLSSASPVPPLVCERALAPAPPRAVDLPELGFKESQSRSLSKGTCPPPIVPPPSLTVLASRGAEQPTAATPSEGSSLAELGLDAATVSALLRAGIRTPEALAGLNPEALRAVSGLGRERLRSIRAALERAGLAVAPMVPATRPRPAADPRVRLVTDLWAKVFRACFPGEDPVWGVWHRDAALAAHIAEVARLDLEAPEQGAAWIEGAFRSYLGELGAAQNWPHEPTLSAFANPVKLAGRFTGANRKRRLSEDDVDEALRLAEARRQQAAPEPDSLEALFAPRPSPSIRRLEGGRS